MAQTLRPARPPKGGVQPARPASHHKRARRVSQYVKVIARAKPGRSTRGCRAAWASQLRNWVSSVRALALKPGEAGQRASAEVGGRQPAASPGGQHGRACLRGQRPGRRPTGSRASVRPNGPTAKPFWHTRPVGKMRQSPSCNPLIIPGRLHLSEIRTGRKSEQDRPVPGAPSAALYQPARPRAVDLFLFSVPCSYVYKVLVHSLFMSACIEKWFAKCCYRCYSRYSRSPTQRRPQPTSSPCHPHTHHPPHAFDAARPQCYNSPHSRP